jgi:hypothetical protein
MSILVNNTQISVCGKYSYVVKGMKWYKYGPSIPSLDSGNRKVKDNSAHVINLLQSRQNQNEGGNRCGGAHTSCV